MERTDWRQGVGDNPTSSREREELPCARSSATIRKVVVDVKAMGVADRADAKKVDADTARKMEQAK